MDAICARVAEIIVRSARLSCDEPVEEETPLVGSGLSLDSVSVLEILADLEQEFEIEADINDLIQADALSTVGTLAKYLSSKLERSGE